MAKETNNERFILKLPTSLRTRLEAAAQKESMSMAQVIRAALRKYLGEPCTPASQ